MFIPKVRDSISRVLIEGDQGWEGRNEEENYPGEVRKQTGVGSPLEAKPITVSGLRLAVSGEFFYRQPLIENETE